MRCVSIWLGDIGKQSSSARCESAFEDMADMAGSQYHRLASFRRGRGVGFGGFGEPDPDIDEPPESVSQLSRLSPHESHFSSVLDASHSSSSNCYRE